MEAIEGLVRFGLGTAGSIVFLWNPWRRLIERMEKHERQLQVWLTQVATGAKKRDVIEGKVQTDLRGSYAVRLFVVLSAVHVLTSGILGFAVGYYGLPPMWSFAIPGLGEASIRLARMLKDRGQVHGTDDPPMPTLAVSAADFYRL